MYPVAKSPGNSGLLCTLVLYIYNSKLQAQSKKQNKQIKQNIYILFQF